MKTRENYYVKQFIDEFSLYKLILADQELNYFHPSFNPFQAATPSQINRINLFVYFLSFFPPPSLPPTPFDSNHQRFMQ
jgi:hypothetical protein